MAAVMEDEVFKAFTTHATIMLVKLLLMAPLTSVYRISRGAFANEEDVALKLKPMEERKKLLRTHPDVERVRRCHQNDLETVVPFVLLGLLYALTGPDLSLALLHFRIFSAARIFHSVSYVGALPQPCRALSWMLGMAVNFSMAFRLLQTTLVL